MSRWVINNLPGAIGVGVGILFLVTGFWLLLPELFFMGTAFLVVGWYNIEY